MNKLDKQYTNLLQDILINGVVKSDRTGTGTISIFGRQIRHKMSEGFPLLTTKKMPFKTIATELLWFLRGDTNIKFLVDNNCHIWDGDAYKNYLSKVQNYADSLSVPDDISEFKGVIDSLNKQIKSSVLTQEEFINKIKINDEFAKEWGELGPIYGKQWRSWKTSDTKSLGGTFWGPTTEITENSIDQIANLINDLKTNPDSRRLIVNSWNVGQLSEMVLPPCHYGFQVYTRELSLEERYQLALPIWKEKYGPLADMMVPTNVDNTPYKIPLRAISLMWNQRSVDTFLGLPFNIASYGLLLEIIAKAVNMVPDELIGNLGDVHLYSNHIEQAKEQIDRDGFELPTLKHMKTEAFYKSLSEDVSLVTHLDNTDFEMENYQSHPSIKAPLSN
jgi:thymidylate synthase